MKALESQQRIWKRELAFAQQKTFWLHFALEAQACAAFLRMQWESAVMQRFGVDSALPGSTNIAFFAPKFVRYLMGIALENAVKGLLLSGPDRGQFIKSDRISFGSKGHDLRWLFDEAGVSVTDDEAFYVSAWTISVEWFGRYPFPTQESRVLDEPQPLSSPEALVRRRLRGKRKYMHRDLLHGGIGHGEWAVFETVFRRLEQRYAAKPTAAE